MRKSNAEQPGPIAIEHLDPCLLMADPRNARRHPKEQLVRLEAAIREFGFTGPLTIDEHQTVIAGHARLAVAKALKWQTVPCVRLVHLSATQKRVLAIADNRIAESAEWDPAALQAEFEAICGVEFPVELTGFATAEIDSRLGAPALGTDSGCDPADVVAEPERIEKPISQVGDCWIMGRHRLYCGNALVPNSYETLLADQRAAMIITDPPYNLPIQGHVSGLGKTKHPEFAMASGEMSKHAHTAFLKGSMSLMASFSIDGSIHFLFMDWRHIEEITTAATDIYSELKAVCVWNKTNGGMGSLYRSKHELVFVYKNGAARHCNNIELGKNGRYRTMADRFAVPAQVRIRRMRHFQIDVPPLSHRVCALI